MPHQIPNIYRNPKKNWTMKSDFNDVTGWKLPVNYSFWRVFLGFMFMILRLEIATHFWVPCSSNYIVTSFQQALREKVRDGNELLPRRLMASDLFGQWLLVSFAHHKWSSSSINRKLANINWHHVYINAWYIYNCFIDDDCRVVIY